MTEILALAAAALFALGTVLQQREPMREPVQGALGAGFIGRLARRPIWLAGIAADGLGFIAQAAALGVGRMVVVQPILAMTVIFALPLGARLSGQRISSRDLIAAAVTTAGLAILLALGNPSAGRDGAPVEARVGLLYATIEGQLELPVLGRLLVPPPPPSEAGAA